MKNRRRLLLALTAAASSLVMPAAPVHALPHCGGTWINYARCTFEAPGGAFAISGTATEGEQGPRTTGSVKVRVYVEVAGLQHTLGGCANHGVTPVTCTTLVETQFEGYPHYCEVSGTRRGTYACADPPRLPAPSVG